MVVDQPIDVIDKHRERTEVGVPVTGLTRPCMGSVATQRSTPCSRVSIRNLPIGVVKGCRIALQLRSCKTGPPICIPLGGSVTGMTQTHVDRVAQSTVVVALNAQLLRRFDPSPEASVIALGGAGV